MKVAVIGGGPAGCAAAYTLRKHGHEAVLFEAQDHVGGRTSQVLKDGFNLGSGALFLMGGIYPRTNAILKEMGHYDELVRWNADTEVLDADGRRYTAKFDQVLSFLGMSALSWKDKLRIATGVVKQLLTPGPKLCFDGAELARHDSGESLETWSRRVLGDRGHNYITVPYMGFLYAVPMSWLSPALFHAVLKQFYRLSLSVPPQGMGQICDWLIKGSPGLDLRLSAPVERITKAGNGYVVSAADETHTVDAVIVAPEPGVAAELLSELIPEASTKKLRECLYSDYAHVQVCYKRNPWPQHHASVALPANMERDWGACVLLSKRQPTAVPPGGEAVGVYFYTPPLEHLSDDAIIKSAIDAVHEVYGPASEPDFVELFHYRRGLSIANPGHYGRLDSLHAEMPPGIYLAGDYFAHAGVEAAIFSGELAASRLAQDHR
ncbi:protoporphyrinogen/coproporphyrinogen oxidase [[Mycobacterium] zoologicum]|uniref:protoporphyrinogen/coproporphyrinogen oxidase n=1 Tax=[Mycobacterium] zoologicum TaxID=2872311 RepID=UPI00272C553B|nr:NAD(P)/FAD-dependent oxidoreductase [Mycolicibacter sp. MYC101]MEB3061936.1 NAD(P)/FAD-dependent oxidoreductase [Mycolicibacter sp. MYC101]